MKIFLTILMLLVSMETNAQSTLITTGVYRFADAPVTKSTDREGRRFFLGTSPQMSLFESHATVQQKGAIPKPPHAQEDIEELIIVKDGKMKFNIDGKIHILGKNSAILIPPHAMQSAENVGEGPLSYQVFEFRSNKAMDMDRSAKAGGALFMDADSLPYVASEKGGGVKYFDRPTAMTENFEMHITELKHKGPSHAPHKHIDTEIIFVIDGETEIQVEGKTYHASTGDICIINSNEFHGVGNAKESACKYFAFKWR